MQHRRIVSAASLTIAVLCLFDSASAQTVSVWNNTSGGSWFTASNWADGQVPQNSPEQEFDVRIDAFAHLPYVVSLASDAQIRSLRLNSDRASLRLMSGTLRVEDRADLLAGRLSLVGGTIEGGTWFAAPGTVAIGTHPLNHLRGVTWIGDLPLDGIGSRLAVSDGLLVDGRILLSGLSSRLEFAGTQTVDAAEIQMSAADATSTIFAQPDSDTTIGNSTLIHGSGSFLGTGRIVNAGAIVANDPSATLTIAPLNFENAGSVRMVPGTACVIGANNTNWQNGPDGSILLNGGTLDVRGAWANSGEIVAGGSLLRLFGTFSTPSLLGIWGGGVVEVRGTINNTGSVLDLAQMRTALDFAACTVQGGSIRASDSSPLRVTGGTARFDQTAIDGPIELFAGGIARISSSTELHGPVRFVAAGRTLQFDADRILNGIPFDWSNDVGIISAEGTGSLTFGPKQLLAGRRMQITSNLLPDQSSVIVRNEGLIRVPSNGNTVINPRQFENHGRIEQNGGTLTIGVTQSGAPGTSWNNSNDGEIVATDGTLTFGGTWENAGLIETSGTLVTLGGLYHVGSLGNLHRAGGNLIWSGTLDLLGKELVVGDALGVINIADLTIRNGTLSFEGAGDYRFVRRSAAGSHLRLRSTDIHATLDVRGSESQPFQISVEIDRDSSVSGGISLGPFSELFVESDEPWETEITIDELASTRIWVVGSNPEFVFGPNCVIQGGGVEFRRPGVDPIVNRGIVACGHPDQFVILACTFINEGEFRVGAGAQLLPDQFWNGRFVNADTGSVCVCGTDAYSNLADRWENAGVFRIEDGVGQFGTGQGIAPTNEGRIELISATAEFLDGLPNAGTIAIDEASTLHARSLSCMPTSTLEFGLAAFDARARIECDLRATLAGALRILLDEGYTPIAGDSLRLLTARTVSGDFDAIEIVGLPSGIRATVLVSATAVDVQFEQDRGELSDSMKKAAQHNVAPP